MKKIIGIDLHGVITESPKEFKKIITILMNNEVLVYIISGPPTAQVIDELNLLGIICYDKVLSVVDYLKETIGEENMWQDENGDWWASKKDWWSSKAKICKDNKVHIMIDDKIEYGNHFTDSTLFLLYRNWHDCWLQVLVKLLSDKKGILI